MFRFGPSCALLLATALLLIACDRSPFPGYKPVADGVHLKLHMLGDGERLPTDSDSVLVRVRLAKRDGGPGSLFSTERWFDGLDDVLPEGASGAVQLHQGDSVGFITFGRHMPWVTMGAEGVLLPDTEMVRVELSLIAVRSMAESRRLALEQRVARTAADEDSTLARYFASELDLWDSFMGVFYKLDRKLPKGPKVLSGQVVTIAYTAHFLEDGRLFDDTHGTGQPLTFRLGDPGQVIKGLEVAVHLLAKGGKGRFIIPSELAFGAEGSSSGIVPPYTPVLYTVEVLDVSTEQAETMLADSAAAM